MNKKIIKYNPAFLDDEELIQSFVVRHPELEIILGILKENNGPSNQHILLLGPRGIGKTTLARRVAAEIRKKPEYHANWHPIIFGEESYQVGSPGEFWLEALFHIAEQTQEERWNNTYEELHSERDETRLRERALAQLMDFADEKDKRLLLIVENLNMIVGQQFNRNSEDVWVIRHTLTNEPRIMLLGTAISRFKEVEQYDYAMYDLFKEIVLHPLDDEDCIKLWESITGEKPSLNRIRPIKILTGGNPRLLNIISTFGAKSSFRELMENLTHLVDEHTEYFKSHLDRFSPLDRKVFVALADLWDPSTARDVANAARMEVNKTSTILLRLVERGAVEVADQKAGSKWYQLAERMYNIYHLMRRRGHPSNRVRAVVRFMVNFYEGEELVKVTNSLVSEVRKLKPELREDHFLAYESILKTIHDEAVKNQILKNSRPLLKHLPDIPESIKKLLGEKIVKVFNIHKQKSKIDNYELIFNNLKEWENLSGDSEGIQIAENNYRVKVNQEPKNADFWFLLGFLLKKQPAKYNEAAQAFNKTIQLKPNHFLAFVLLGLLFHDDLKRFEEAESTYKKALGMNPEYDWAWSKLGQLYHEELKRFEEAESAYKKAIEIDPEDDWTWAQLGQLYHEELKRIEEAESAYRKAVELDPENSWAWAQLGRLLHEQLNRFGEAESAYKKAIELYPDFIWAWAHLGRLLHEKLNRFEEAESAYKKAIELYPDYGWAWANLGLLLHNELKRFEEAESAYRKAIEIDPEYSWAWESLIMLKIDKMNNLEEAIEIANQFLTVNEQSAENLNAVAWTLFESHCPEALSYAETWAKMAVEKEPENANVLHTLACILAVTEKCQEAPAVSKQFLKHAEMSDEIIEDTIELYINLAVAGCGEEALEQIKASKHAEALEPLIVGIQLYLGQKVETAQEIQEIGKDVAKKIQERKLELQN